MGEQDISQLSQSSVELSKAIADFGALAVIGGVFMVFVLLILSLFVYQLFTQQKKLSSTNHVFYTLKSM
jgi:hypothetical protein